MRPNESRVIGHLMADGYVPKESMDAPIIYSNTNQQNLKEFISLFKKTFGVRPHLLKNRAQLYSIKIKAYLHKKYNSFYCREWRIPKEILEGNRKVKMAFLQAFIIDEGTKISNNTFYVSSANRFGLKQLQKIGNIFFCNTGIIKFYNKKYRRIYYLLKLKGIKGCFPESFEKMFKSNKISSSYKSYLNDLQKEIKINYEIKKQKYEDSKEYTFKKEYERKILLKKIIKEIIKEISKTQKLYKRKKIKELKNDN